jgi:hypothetical protein
MTLFAYICTRACVFKVYHDISPGCILPCFTRDGFAGTSSRELSISSQHPILPTSEDDSLFRSTEHDPPASTNAEAAHPVRSDTPPSIKGLVISGDDANPTSPSDISPQELQAIAPSSASPALNPEPPRVGPDTDTGDESSLPSSPTHVRDKAPGSIPGMRASSHNFAAPITLLHSGKQAKILSPSRLWRPKSLQSLLPWRRSQTSLDPQAAVDPPHEKSAGQTFVDVQSGVEPPHPGPRERLRTSLTSFPWLSKRPSHDLPHPEPSHDIHASDDAHHAAAAPVSVPTDTSATVRPSQAQPLGDSSHVEVQRCEAVPPPRQVAEAGCQVDDSNPAVNSPLTHGLPRVQSHIAVWVPDALEPPFFRPSPITRSPVNPPTIQGADSAQDATTPLTRPVPPPPVAPRRSLLHTVTQGRWGTSSARASNLGPLPRQPPGWGTQETQTPPYDAPPAILPELNTLRICDGQVAGSSGVSAAKLQGPSSRVGRDEIADRNGVRGNIAQGMGSIPGQDTAQGGPCFSPQRLSIPEDASADMANHSPLALGLTQRQRRTTDGSTTPEGSVVPTPRVYSPLQDGMFGRRGWLRPSALFTSSGGTPRDAFSKRTSGRWPTWMSTDRQPEGPLDSMAWGNNRIADTGGAGAETAASGETGNEEALAGSLSARGGANEGVEEGLHGSGVHPRLNEKGGEGNQVGGTAADSGRGSLRDVTALKTNMPAGGRPGAGQKPEQLQSARCAGNTSLSPVLVHCRDV